MQVILIKLLIRLFNSIIFYDLFIIWLEGAAWDRRGCRLIEQRAKILFEPIPVIHIYAINTTMSPGEILTISYL